MKKMRSALFVGKDLKTQKSIVEVQEFDVPWCDADKILVKVEASGLCTYEQRVYLGIHHVEYPFVAGHEVAGEIVDIGKEIDRSYWHIGDKVVVGVTLPCRNCEICKTGNEQACQTFTTDKQLPGQPCKGSGGLSEYMMQKPDSIFKYYDVPAYEACMVEPLSCCIHSVETVNPQFGDTCLIIGAGMMGLLHLQLCLKKGTKTIVVDMNDDRLSLAKELGAHEVINNKKENVLERLLEITHGNKANAVFDTIPFANMVHEACQYVSNLGKLMIYSGIYPNEPVTIDAHWIHKGSIQILGSANSNDRDFVRASSMISNHIINVQPFISGLYPVEHIEKALLEAPGKFRNIVLFDKKGE